MSKRQASRGRDVNRAETAKVRALDELAEYEEFKEQILPLLRKDVKSGMDASQLREKYKPLAQARIISQALADASAVGLAAAKDLLDRQDGKAKETKEVEHKFSKLSDEQINAILLSEQAEIADEEDEATQS